MYKRYNNNYKRNGSSGFRRGPAARGARFDKSFNPSSIIINQKPVDKTDFEEEAPQFSRFSDFALSDQIVANVTRKGYETPTPIQDKAIPHILLGKDVIGIANTGTGKTAAFLLPLIEKVIKDRQKKVLIVAPTRELAVQIRDEFIIFSQGLNMFSVLCIGGVNLMRQKNDLRRSYNFVIGTPGRLKDLIKGRNLYLSQFDSVVLDEADHMVDIGFLQDVKYLISLLPKNRQSLFFSATIDGKVKEVLASFVQYPVTVSVKVRDTVASVKQDIVKVIDKNRKIDQLHDLLIQKEYEKVLIFGRTKWGVQKLSDELARRGFSTGAIHGNKNQSQRQRTLDQFKRHNIKILLATDVASRGLDIDDVSHVINYDLPATYDDYIHRIGRTGRAKKNGVALTFID